MTVYIHVVVMEVPYSSPIDISNYPNLALFFLASGFVTTCIFFVYQVQVKKVGKSTIAIELSLGLVASVFLGVGSFFGMMAFDLYV